MTNALWLTQVSNKFSERLKQAISVGMVELQVDDERRSARILAPSDTKQMSDDDWLVVIQAASEVRDELMALGFYVKG